MKRISALIFALLFFSEIAAAQQKESDETKRWAFVPDVVAEINDRKISKAEFIKEVKAQFPLGDVSVMPEDQLRDVSKKILEQHIDRLVLEKLMKDAGIVPGPEIVAEGFKKKLSLLSPEQLVAMEKKLEKILLLQSVHSLQTLFR